jgi:hypothetical protein
MEPMNTHDAIREMEAALNENPPPSGKELRRRTGLQAVSLRRRHPVLFTKILDRYRNFHRSGNVTNEEGEIMLRAALIEDPPPSLQSVFRRMGFRSSGYRFYERFPELCRAVSARYKTHRSKSFDVEKTRQALEAALIEEPPPSFSLVANRIHHGRSFLRKTYPAQTAALVARYDIWLTASRRETNDTLLREVEDAIRSLQAEGLRLSLKPIRSRLSRYGNDRLFRLAVRQVKEKLGVQD